MIRHHAFVIEAGANVGIAIAQEWLARELGLETKKNPDIAILNYGLLSAEDARAASELASGAPFAGIHRVVIITATRAYHEAQNMLLKLFEEPPAHAILFLIMPSLGGLLPTLRSRVQTLSRGMAKVDGEISAAATEFIAMGPVQRSIVIKKLASGKDDEARRDNREKAIELIHGIEQAAYANFTKERGAEHVTLLRDISTLRTYLYDRSAPMKMILEHIALVIPESLR